jgi:hypothetical protein
MQQNPYSLGIDQRWSYYRNAVPVELVSATTSRRAAVGQIQRQTPFRNPAEFYRTILFDLRRRSLTLPINRLTPWAGARRLKRDDTRRFEPNPQYASNWPR